MRTKSDAKSGNGAAIRTSGEIAGTSAAEVRASLRRIGLQVIDVKPVRRRRASRNTVLAALQGACQDHLRNRRRSARAEIYDSISTMLGSGVPLLEALDTLIQSRRTANGQPKKEHAISWKGWRKQWGGLSMLEQVRLALKSGNSLSLAMREHPAWFELTEIAMVEAGQHGGNLPQVLQSLTHRHERSGELGHKLLTALAYPMIVLAVGIGVVIFLSVKTLPDLVKILADANVAAPPLTEKIMWFGQVIANHWMAMLFGLAAAVLLALIVPRLNLPVRTSWLGRRFCGPRVLRTIAVGGLSQRLAELVRSGVPIVDALKVLAPTIRSRELQRLLRDAADRVERGDELSAALDDPRWFDAEFRRLLDIGQAVGELDQMLDRIGQRYQRQARRLIDRLTALLEPIVILSLALLVGTVVMAAVLPLLKLQEVL